MTGKTHMAIGVALGLSLAANKPVNEQLIIVGVSAIGSLLPDLDHPKAKLNQKILLFKNKLFSVLFYLSISASLVYFYLQQGESIFLLLALTIFLMGISSHRGFTHSILGFLLVSNIARLVIYKYNLNFLIYKSFTLSYLSHLLTDFLTPKGIQLFYPIGKNIASPLTINPKSGVDEAIFAFLSIYCFLLLYR